MLGLNSFSSDLACVDRLLHDHGSISDFSLADAYPSTYLGIIRLRSWPVQLRGGHSFFLRAVSPFSRFSRDLVCTLPSLLLPTIVKWIRRYWL